MTCKFKKECADVSQDWDYICRFCSRFLCCKWPKLIPWGKFKSTVCCGKQHICFHDSPTVKFHGKLLNYQRVNLDHTTHVVNMHVFLSFCHDYDYITGSSLHQIDSFSMANLTLPYIFRWLGSKLPPKNTPIPSFTGSKYRPRRCIRDTSKKEKLTCLRRLQALPDMMGPYGTRRVAGQHGRHGKSWKNTSKRNSATALWYRVLQKNSHPPTCCHITPDPPAPPWSMLLPNACRHPNRNGCFFWRPFEAKRCNNIELGERGHASFFAMSLTGWLFFWRTRTQSGKDFLVYGTDVQTQAWTNYLLHLPQPQSKHTLIFKAATQQTKKHKIFWVYGCANASLNKFPFARATTPIQRHVHLHSCYPQTKNVPPRLQKQNCTNCVLHSARTVHAHGTVHATVHGHKTL